MPKLPIAPRVRLAQNLKALIELHEMTAPRVAALAKVDAKTVNNLLNGRFDPRLSLVEKVASVFNMAAWQLLATDLRSKHIDSAQIVRLVEAYGNAKAEGKTAIMQVAQVVGSNEG